VDAALFRASGGVARARPHLGDRRPRDTSGSVGRAVATDAEGQATAEWASERGSRSL